MINGILCGLFSAFLCVALVALFSKIDRECMGPICKKRLVMLSICAFIGEFFVYIQHDVYGIMFAPAIGFFMFSTYSDVQQQKTYALVNIVFMAVYGIMFVITSFDILVCVLTIFACVLSCMGLCGMADGLFISTVLYMYAILTDSPMIPTIMFLMVAAVVFFIYCLIIHIKDRKNDSKIKFFKRKYPFIPALTAGALVILMI